MSPYPNTGFEVKVPGRQEIILVSGAPYLFGTLAQGKLSFALENSEFAILRFLGWGQFRRRQLDLLGAPGDMGQVLPDP